MKALLRVSIIALVVASGYAAVSTSVNPAPHAVGPMKPPCPQPQQPQ
jgi:hypothetical protein